MKKTNLTGKTIFGKQVMSTVSVMIVLLILGLFAAFAVGATRFSDALRSRMGFTVVMSDDVKDETVQSMRQLFEAAPYASTVTYTSAAETLAQWERDNGENVIDVLGVNPFGAQLEVTVKPEWAVRDSILSIASRVEALEGVDEVSTTTQIVDVINRVVDTLTMIFIPLALALLLVSGVLINNTVRLTVYSSRFLIHTMKLVGATGAFIRRPFIRTAILNGVLAGIVADALLAAAVWGVGRASADVALFVNWLSLWWVFPALILLGIAICGTAAAMAANKYLRLGYDEMF